MTIEEELHYLDLQSSSPDNLYRRVLDYLSTIEKNNEEYQEAYQEGHEDGYACGYDDCKQELGKREET